MNPNSRQRKPAIEAELRAVLPRLEGWGRGRAWGQPGATAPAAEPQTWRGRDGKGSSSPPYSLLLDEEVLARLWTPGR